MTQSDRTAGVPTAITFEAACWLLLLAATFILCAEFVGLWAACESAIVLSLSWWLVRKTTVLFNFRRVMITGFWYLTYLAMIFIPAFFVFGDQEDPYRSRYLFAVHSVLITVPIGWLLANWFCRFRKCDNERFFLATIANTGNARRLKTVYLFLLIPSIILTIIYVRSVETIPLFYLLRNPGEYMQVALLREDSFKLLDSPFSYAFYVLRAAIFPFLVLVSLGCYLQTRKAMWRNLFVGTLALALFYCSLSIAKSPVAAIIVLMGFLFYYYRGGIVSKRAVVVFLICVLLFPIIVISVAYQDVADVGFVFQAISQRLFYIPSEAVYYYFEVFPSHHEFLHGRSIDKFARLMGWLPFDSANYVGMYEDPTGIESVSDNAAFVADLNADFGMLGVLLGGLLTGFIMQWFHIYAVRRKKTVITVALYSFLVYIFWFLNSTSLPIVLASNGVILICLISWWFEKRSILNNAQLGPEKLAPVQGPKAGLLGFPSLAGPGE
jgi:oligosaccharide repeat unit polymerase